MTPYDREKSMPEIKNNMSIGISTSNAERQGIKVRPSTQKGTVINHVFQNDYATQNDLQPSQSSSGRNAREEGNFHSPHDNSPLSRKDDDLKSTRSSRSLSSKSIALDDLYYYKQKDMENNRLNKICTQSDSAELFSSKLNNNGELLVTEDENCFRLSKPNVHQMQNIGTRESSIQLNQSVDDLNVNRHKTGHKTVYQSNKRRTSYWNFDPKEYPSEASEIEIEADFINSPDKDKSSSSSFGSSDTHLSPEMVEGGSNYVQPDSEEDVDKRKTKFGIRSTLNHTDYLKSNTDKNDDASKNSEEAYADFIAEIERAFFKQKSNSENTGNEGYIGGLEKLKALSRSIEITESIKNKDHKQQISCKSNERIKLVPEENQKQGNSVVLRTSITRNSVNYPSIGNVRMKQTKKDLWVKSQTGDVTNSLTNRRSNARLYSVNWPVKGEDLNGNMCNIPYNSDQSISQMYQYWPMDYVWYTNLLNYNFYVQNLISLESTYTNPGIVPAYTGVAGYNWPTIRKPLRNSELEEKRDYPVYVKPPLLGNEETENIRNAFQKYVSWLKYKVYTKTVRLRKQKMRRERNHKLMIISKQAKPKEMTHSETEETGPMPKKTEEEPEHLETITDDVTKLESNLENYTWVHPSVTGLEFSTAKPSESRQNNDLIEKEEFSKYVSTPESNPYNKFTNISQHYERSSKEHRDAEYRIPKQNTQSKFFFHPILGPVCKRKESIVTQL
ncbi:uncharacterized protein LOC128982919 [Macrosteles quadrilineatus]|uniref:uncharacterized protein LOC128982919 n=1 Tax=Macrosteles quadrilineatus TaxID=74068 RepID=UPI0023E346DA|nr:uncharacterized protein LOC128982919 [Macrosteles quadrilineatus]